MKIGWVLTMSPSTWARRAPDLGVADVAILLQAAVAAQEVHQVLGRDVARDC
jgi:hypothetical protein